MYTDIDYRVHYSWGGIKLNQAGTLIQFTLDEPEYMIEDSKAVSKRIRDIKNILEMRYCMEFVSQIYFSQSYRIKVSGLNGKVYIDSHMYICKK